jgi:hypothetical protein
MGREPLGDCMGEFVEAVARAGLMLARLVSDLADGLPDDAYPGESNVDVVLDMMAGSLRPVADAFGEQFVRQAIQLLADSQDRILTDLRLAAELATRREQGTRGKGSLN